MENIEWNEMRVLVVNGRRNSRKIEEEDGDQRQRKARRVSAIHGQQE